MDKLYCKLDELAKLECTFDEFAKLRMSSMSWISCTVSWMSWLTESKRGMCIKRLFWPAYEVKK